MPIEIEKKYRLNRLQRLALNRRLREVGATEHQLEFEENTIYGGGRLDFGGCALRLRRVGRRAILTFKQRLPTQSPIKHQREEETEVAKADALNTILEALGFRPALVYEKRRRRWQLGRAEVVVDELPFGLFMEIEAPEKEIARIEKLLGAEVLPAVMETYPTLTTRFGRERNGVIEARFVKSVRKRSGKKTRKV
jgi:adenylate cyclase class 2